MKTTLLAPIKPETIKKTAVDFHLAERIRRLSVEAIIAGISVCTACGESTGNYIISYKGARFNYDARQTCAFLENIVSR